MPLATEAARAAVAEKLKGLGDSPEDIAREMHRIIVSSMIQVVRGVSVSRGRDPRGLAMISFGGAAALFAAEICRGVGIPRLLIPEYASVFSAVGLISADPIRTEARSVHWSPESGPLATLQDVLNDLTHRATANMRARGFADAKIALEYSADMRFSGQSFDVSVPLASSQLEERDRGALIGSFQHVYSTLYGPGSVWRAFHRWLPRCVSWPEASATSPRSSSVLSVIHRCRQRAGTSSWQSPAAGDQSPSTQPAA